MEIPLSVSTHSTVRSLAETSPLADFLRYHVLIRVFGGRTREWLEILHAGGRSASADARFLRWLDERLHADPTLLRQIREMVDASGLWPAGQ